MTIPLGADRNICELRCGEKWQDSSSSEVIVTTARANSPIAVTGWVWDGVVHVRFVDFAIYIYILLSYLPSTPLDSPLLPQPI